MKSTPPLGFFWFTWCSTDENWFGTVRWAGAYWTHHVVHLRVHIQLDYVGVTNDCNRAGEQEWTSI